MRRWLCALMLVCTAVVAAEPPVSDKPPMMDHAQPADEPLSPSDNQAFIDDAVRAFGSREKAASLAAQSGWHHQQKGDIAVATRRFNQALILDPQCADAYWGLGVMTGQQGKYDFARQMLARARKLDPANPQLLTDSGIIVTRHALSLPAKSAAQKKMLEEAIQWFNQAEKRDPSYQPLYTSRAIALTHLGKTKEAQSNLLRAEVLERASVDTRMVEHLSRKFVAQATPPAKPVAQAAKANNASHPTAPSPSAPQTTPPAVATTPAVTPVAPVDPDAVASDAEARNKAAVDTTEIAQIERPPPVSVDGLAHELFYVVPAAIVEKQAVPSR